MAFEAPYEYAHQYIATHVPPHADILDFACGTGLHAIQLAERGYSVTGIDISPSSVAAATRSARLRQTSNCSFINGDQTAAELKGSCFDAIFISGALYYLDLDQLGPWFMEHLKPGGHFIAVETVGDNRVLSSYRRIRSRWTRDRDEWTLEHLLTRTDLARFGRAFDVCELRYFDLLTLAGRVFRHYPPLERLWCRAVRPLDRVLLNAGFHSLAFKAVFTGKKAHQ